MTEKRFVMEDLEILCRILDNGKVINGIEIVNLLNTLNDENEQLKKDNVHLKVLLGSLQDRYSGLLKLVHGFDKNE